MNHLDFESLTDNNEREKDLDIHNIGVITLADRHMYLSRPVNQQLWTETHLQELIFKRQNSSTSG